MLSSSLIKNKIISNDEGNLEDEEIILHLPISKAELIEINSLGYSINDIVDKNSYNSSNESDENISSNEIKLPDNYIKQLSLIIKKLKDENEELKNYLKDITPMYFTEVKVYPIDLKLFDMDQNKLIPLYSNKEEFLTGTWKNGKLSE
jgi:predicted RNase H-like nuclease (RuvC/YqgF family)